MRQFDSLHAFFHTREVDIVLSQPRNNFALHLHANFNGHGDFLSIFASDVEYVEIPGTFTVADSLSGTETRQLAALSPKWSNIGNLYSGPWIAFRSTDSLQWGDLANHFVVIANQIEWFPGLDWDVSQMSRR